MFLHQTIHQWKLQKCFIFNWIIYHDFHLLFSISLFRFFVDTDQYLGKEKKKNENYLPTPTFYVYNVAENKYSISREFMCLPPKSFCIFHYP